MLEVAQTVFAAEGLAVPIDEIARRAGLGVGTLYRHFPTKEALFAAIVVTRMEDVAAEARSLLDADDPGKVFFEFLVQWVSSWSQKKDFIDALASAGVDLKDVKRAKLELYAQLGNLLERAQEAGAVRKDVAIREVVALVGGTFGSLDRHGISIEGRDRMLSIVFAGLRAEAPEPKKAKARRR